MAIMDKIFLSPQFSYFEAQIPNVGGRIKGHTTRTGKMALVGWKKLFTHTATTENCCIEGYTQKHR
jgi:hypothetical protein